MNTKQNLLERFTQASKHYTKLMNQYKIFFNCLFTNPLQAFGYERWTTDNMYFGLSNMPAIAELFVEVDAFEDQNVIIQPKYMSSFCTFIYPDAKILKMAITAASDTNTTASPIPPCGGCRQTISEYEFKQEQPIEIYFMGEIGKIYKSDSLKNLLPLLFDKNFL